MGRKIPGFIVISLLLRLALELFQSSSVRSSPENSYGHVFNRASSKLYAYGAGTALVRFHFSHPPYYASVSYYWRCTKGGCDFYIFLFYRFIFHPFCALILAPSRRSNYSIPKSLRQSPQGQWRRPPIQMCRSQEAKFGMNQYRRKADRFLQ